MDEAAKTPKPKYDGAELQKEGSKWIERIRAAEKREDEWRKDAKAAEKAFAADTKETDGTLYDFNILHSNVETIVPAIYNSTPVPDVRRRFVEATGSPPEPPQPQQGSDGQPIPPPPQAMKQFQMAMQEHQASMMRDKDAKSFGEMVERAITVQIDDNRLDTEVEREAQDAFLSGRGIIRVKFDADDDGQNVTNERLEFEAVSWRDFRMGPATRWQNVPWIAFRHVVSREALEGYTDNEVDSAQAAAPYPSEGVNDEDDVAFWEIWCKTTKKVKFIREYDCRMMKIEPDPLGLKGFYPIPPPVQPITLTAKMTPVCPFTIYKKLADELDTITKRINRIMKGLKVRGIVIGSASKILDMASAEDNELVVDADLEGLAQVGLDKAVLWWPVEQAIKVLKELYAQREIVKASIYEITGISDIIRGASNANETLGAQEIKTQWGALRIQKMQRMIERQVRDLFGMMAEIITSKFSPETLYQMTGIEVTEGMAALMQQPILTSYRVDVESDSTVRADLTRVKAEMAEFMTGTANYFKTMAPVVQSSPQMAEPVAEIYSSFAGVFNLGKQAEDALDKMAQIAKQAAANPPPNPEAEAAKMEAEAKAQDRQADMQMKQAEFQMKNQAEQNKEQRAAEAEQRKLAFEQQKAQIDLMVAKTNLEIKQIELAIRKEEAHLSLQTKAVESQIKVEGARQTAAIKAENAKKPVTQSAQ